MSLVTDVMTEPLSRMKCHPFWREIRELESLKVKRKSEMELTPESCVDKKVEIRKHFGLAYACMCGRVHTQAYVLTHKYALMCTYEYI